MLVVVLAVVAFLCVNSQQQQQRISNIVAIDYARGKNSTAGVFFEHYRSNMPVAMLVDNTREAHEDAERFIRTVDEMRLNTIMVEFLLMKFNGTGVTQIQTSNIENKNLFDKLLKWSEEYETMPTSIVGYENTNATALFFGILNAAHLLPYGSGVLVFTDRAIVDEDLANLALQEVRRKGIRIFVVWGGISPGVGNKERLLREIAVYSGGAFIVGTERKLSDKYNKLYKDTRESTEVKHLVLLRKNLQGQQVFHFPINSDVTEIHISISFSAITALLTPPNGYVMNILNDMEVENFSFGSFVVNAPHLGSYEVQLNVAQQSIPKVGIWHLYVGSSNVTDTYNVTVSVQTTLMATVTFPQNKKTDLQNSSSKQLIKVELSGDIAEVKKVTFLDEKGEPLRKNIEFTLNKKAEELNDDTESIEPSTNGNEIDIETETIPDTPFYVKVRGKDANGTEFSRITYYNTRTTQFTVPTLTVEVGLGSQLLVIPNQFSKLFFEVTNNRAQTVFVRFRCHDDKSFLVRMDPISSWLNPHQTVIVTVITHPRYNSQSSYRDLITFVVTGADQIEKKVYMDISDSTVDYDDPYVTHKYTSDCLNVLLGNCADGTWSIEVTAQDTGSGILQLASNPTGLYFPNGYISGTTEKITGYYTGSCCQPRLQITAADRVGNRKIYTADAYYSYLSASAISAIVLGVVLLILIIIGLILLCKFAKCACCRNRDSVDLPTYRGPSGSTRRT